MTTENPAAALRTGAASVITRTAERLMDPQDVSARVTALERAYGPTRGYAPWHPASLGTGHPGIALLFATLGRTEPELRKVCHSHLRSAMAAQDPPARPGLFSGAASVAFAARVARRGPGDYASLLRAAERRTAALAERILTDDAGRRDSGGCGASMRVYDVISGLTGLGRQLLSGATEHRAVLDRVLGHLVALTVPTSVDGHLMPGWWTADRPGGLPAEEVAQGHLNPGLAHGVAGPLALLSLAHARGVRVAGHADAIHRVVDWLLARRVHDAFGSSWPHAVPLANEVRGDTASLRAGRAAWCNGLPGISHAILLASAAMGRCDWRAVAADMLASALGRPTERRRIHDASICHGAAGLLHIVSLMARATGDPRLEAALPGLVADVLARADPSRPFLFAAHPPDEASGTEMAADRPGLLDGGAGTALALHSWLHPEDSGGKERWDAALLLA